MKSIVSILAVLATLSLAPIASAEQTTPEQQLQGCPAEVPVIQASNGNYVWVDRTAISHECWIALNGEKGGGRGKGDTGADD